MRFGLTAHRGFKSLRLRQTKHDPDTLLVGVVLRFGHVGCGRRERGTSERQPPPPTPEETPQRTTSTTSALSGEGWPEPEGASSDRKIHRRMARNRTRV